MRQETREALIDNIDSLRILADSDLSCNWIAQKLLNQINEPEGDTSYPAKEFAQGQPEATQEDSKTTQQEAPRSLFAY